MDMRKDLLNLYFHKYLVYKNTTIIILFTYLIAIMIPFLIGQLKLKNFIDIILVLIISLGNFAKSEYPAKLNPEKTKSNIFRREQLNYPEFSLVFITIIILFLNEFNYHLKKIPEELKKL